MPKIVRCRWSGPGCQALALPEPKVSALRVPIPISLSGDGFATPRRATLGTPPKIQARGYATGQETSGLWPLSSAALAALCACRAASHNHQENENGYLSDATQSFGRC